MNKKFIYSLCAAAFLMTGCDYNEDNFPGYDEGSSKSLNTILFLNVFT